MAVACYDLSGLRNGGVDAGDGDLAPAGDLAGAALDDLLTTSDLSHNVTFRSASSGGTTAQSPPAFVQVGTASNALQALPVQLSATATSGNLLVLAFGY